MAAVAEAEAASSLPCPGMLMLRREGPTLQERVRAADAIRAHEAPFDDSELAALELTIEDFQSALPRWASAPCAHTLLCLFI